MTNHFSKRKYIKSFWLIFCLFFCVLSAEKTAYSFMSQHPLNCFEKGIKALEPYTGDVQDLAEAKHIFRKLIVRYPDSPLGYLGLSRVQIIEATLFDQHYNMKLIHEEALPNAVKALELGPTLRIVHEHYSEIEKIFENYYLYKKEAQIYLTLYPEDPKTFFIAGSFVLEQDELQKAVEYLSIALDMSPHPELRQKILKRLAWIYLNKFENYVETVKYCKLAMESGEESSEIIEFLGLAYLKLGEYQESVKSWSRAAQLSKHSPEVQYYFLLAQGHLAEKKGNVSDAVNFFEKALRSGNRSIDIHYKLGNLYFDMADYKNAYEHFRRVIDLQPDKANAYFFAGRSIKSLGKNNLAVNYFSKYLTFQTDEQKVKWIRQNMPNLFFHEQLGQR